MTYQEFAQRWSEIVQYPCEITYELGVGGEYDAVFYENVDFNGWKPRKNLVCVLDYDNFLLKDPDYGFNASMFRLMAELLETPEDERGK